ncbi:MAG: winged helix-turn-helix domain-containing protein, partial [Synergistaceae bacterium]|nr:winged helix-turn-helix domain-containing protein [Synergistaceae bacterium]
MSVPRSYEMCRPLLAVLGDGRQHTLEEIERSIIQHFALGPEDLVERTRRGGESVFQHRLRWIKEYLLDNMGLMEASEDGTFIITPDGLEVLRHAPAVIDFKYLRRYKGIRDFRKKHEGEDIPDDIDL